MTSGSLESTPLPLTVKQANDALRNETSSDAAIVQAAQIYGARRGEVISSFISRFKNEVIVFGSEAVAAGILLFGFSTANPIIFGIGLKMLVAPIMSFTFGVMAIDFDQSIIRSERFDGLKTIAHAELGRRAISNKQKNNTNATVSS